MDLIGRVEVRLETSEDKYWAALNALNERNIHVSENLINTYPRLMGGLWGIAELGYDETQVWKQKVTPLILTDFTPFQHGKIDQAEFSNGARSSAATSGSTCLSTPSASTRTPIRRGRSC